MVSLNYFDFLFISFKPLYYFVYLGRKRAPPAPPRGLPPIPQPRGKPQRTDSDLGNGDVNMIVRKLPLPTPIETIEVEVHVNGEKEKGEYFVTRL